LKTNFGIDDVDFKGNGVKLTVYKRDGVDSREAKARLDDARNYLKLKIETSQ